MLTATDIRSEFLNYFAEQGHQIVASSPLVPADDNTLLFTNAGMVQFKDCFLGSEKRAYQRATTSQRCVRAGGKHNDLENVGYTARHHTFFEMLGNFSFGDYFKREAIGFAWEFLTVKLALPTEKLWVTVFEEDDEAYDIWAREIGVPEARIARIGAKDNFWQMGDTGPCGPCSEIFYDHGEDVFGGPPGTPDEDGDRYIEIWNLVFMQFDRSADGTLTPLPKPSVDTGMGLERIAAVLQHVHSNYEIDLFVDLLAHVRRVTGVPQDSDSPSLRVIADHIRSCAFMVVDGVLPSNEGRGYVLRRIIRRAARHGHNLGAPEGFFHQLVEPLAALMGDAYPELEAAKNNVEKALLDEEHRFAETLSQGMKILTDDLAHLSGRVIPGATVFKLYDTFGFPADLTADIAREHNLEIDEAGFEKHMQDQRDRARAASQFKVTADARVSAVSKTEFTGYDHLQESANVVELYVAGNRCDSVKECGELAIVLDRTPFYGESGGQVGDRGSLSCGSASIEIDDTQKSGAGIVHYGRLLSGTIKIGDSVDAQVAQECRAATVRNHSATHLLHAGLRRTLGDHVAQKGSLVTSDSLRFDFSHTQPVNHSELREIEAWVNAEVSANAATQIAEMSMDDALEKGAMALFEEKYGDVVRVVEIGPNSTELCGGTHVQRAGDIGQFRISAETGVAAGVRRIEAYTGSRAVDYTASQNDALSGIAETLKSSVDGAAQRVVQLTEQNRSLQREVDKLKGQLASHAGDNILESAQQVKGVKVVAVQMDNADVKTLRESMDQLKDKLGTAVIVLAAVDNGKVRLIAGVTKDMTAQVKAGELVNHVALQVGGKGGGRADLAQAGGIEPEKLNQALETVIPWLEGKL